MTYFADSCILSACIIIFRAFVGSKDITFSPTFSLSISDFAQTEFYRSKQTNGIASGTANETAILETFCGGMIALDARL